MDRDVNNQVWLTSALNDDDVPRALTLCLSLKRVMTSRRVGVIATTKVSTALREALHRGFDMFFYLDEDRNSAGLKTEDFVKLYAFTLKSISTCVYLAPTMIVVKNCDEIFDEYNGPNYTTVLTQQMNNLSIFMVRPSLTTFEALMNSFNTQNKTEFENYLRSWTKNQSKKEEKWLKEKYYRLLSPQHNNLLGYENDLSIVNVENIPFDVRDDEQFGWFSKPVLELRNLIFNCGVKPILLSKPAADSPMNGNIIRTPFGKEPIAIVGMSCRYPAANNLEEFWNLLSSGEDGTGTPPDFRWRRANKSSQTLSDCRNTNAGFLKTSVEDFDAKFFGISPKEVVFLDPQHRILHELVWEGLEDAALNPLSLEGSEGGVFIGSWTNEYKDVMSQAGHDEFYRIYMGNSIGAAAARISHFLGLTGPSLATESGCSSAMVAVHLACKSLQRGESSFALACGVNLLLTPFNKDIMPMVLSPDGHCKTFDANADGFARAEGCGVLVLKRLSDAVKDGDNIWALIKGSAMTQEGISKSMGTPTIHCESLAMTKALIDGNTAPEQVSYVETHGTGTPVGDPMEIASIAKAYYSENRKEPLLIGSVKTNVGHTESCSGITGIMKVVLAMHHEMIPAHRNFETLNPAIDLSSVPAEIPLKPVSWTRQLKKSRYAGVSSFGITGTDAHVIIEESPRLPMTSLKLPYNSVLERPLHIMKVSAKTADAMDSLLELFSNHFRGRTGDDDDQFKDLAYTANVGRADFSHRSIIIAKSNEHALMTLGKTLLRAEVPSQTTGKICFLFTGQGSQYPEMAKKLYETSPIFHLHFDYCTYVLKTEYNIDITQVLWSDDPFKSREIKRTLYSQTSIFCVEYALLKLWESWGVKPDYVLGHSLGEFAAAVCAEILSVEDALKLVAERSQLIDQLPRGKMLVIKADKQVVDSTMRKFAGMNQNKILDYAAINSSHQTVVAGDSDIVLEFFEYCKQVPLKCIVLGSTHAFHSKHMDPMLNEYRKVAKTLRNLGDSDKSCTFISGMRGSTIDAMNVDAEYWVQHTREKVLFKDASKVAVDLGARVFIEIGPQPVLSALTMMNNDLPLVCLPSLKRNEPEWETILTSLGKLYLIGLEIDWKGVDQFCERKKCRLPNYPFIGKSYWPETRTSVGVNIHPLLGCVIPNASSIKLFQSGLSLRALEYVKDHAIGENIIFPGAGYLEMCLVAGLATVEEAIYSLSPTKRAMKVENLLIHAPMSLDEGKIVQLQTIVELNIGGDYQGECIDMKVNIFRNLGSESSSVKWLQHAHATFSPIISPEERNVETMDCTKFKETILLPTSKEEVSCMYEKLFELGLKFGPTFKSIEKVWRIGSNSMLAKVAVPSPDLSSVPYLVHPVILDAMIQAMMMLRVTSNLKRKLYVPIKIGKFVFLASPTNSDSLYIHSSISDREESGNMSNATALLLDSKGNPLAIMSKVELIDTTVKAIQSVLEQQVVLLPDMYEEVWKPKLDGCDLSLDMKRTSGKFYTDEFKNLMDDFFVNQPIEGLFADLEKYVYLNFLRGLYDCGWKPDYNSKSFSEDALFNDLGIAQKYRKYFGFIMETFAQEGVLQNLDECSTSGISWTIKQMPPSKEEVTTIIKSSFLTNLVAQFDATLLLGRLGELLGSILRDEQSALTVLFPSEKTDYPSVADFYTEYNDRFRVGTVVEKVTGAWMEYAKEQIGDENYILRILEVGSGTGSISGKVLENLESHNIQYEYTYTDISAAFFIAAEKKFEKYSKHMKFAKLNIEEDPLQQGFSPEYFDMVFASDVIHATKDIRQTLQNIRMLMKPHAKLDIQEMTQIIRLCTFCFGLLDGFWRFEDKEIRPKHCTLTKSAWTRVLTEAGYQVNGTFSTINDYHSYFCCERTNVPLFHHLSPLNIASKSKTWLIFHLSSNAISNDIHRTLREITTREAVLVTAGKDFKQMPNGGAEITYQIRKESEPDFTALLKSFQRTMIEGIIYCWGLNKEEYSQEEILKPFFFLTKAILSMKNEMPPRIYAITSGVVPLEDNDMSHFHSSTLWGYLKAMKSENLEIKGKCIEIADGRWDESRLKEVFHEFWNLEGSNMIAFQGKSKLIPRFQPHKPNSSILSLPKGIQRFQLILPETKAVADLQFGPLDLDGLKENEVEVHIKASALNFRDVLSIIKPSDDFKHSNTVGFDFSGVVRKTGKVVTKWKAGDRVCGCNVQGKAMPSHLNVNEDILLKLPDQISYCEGSTIPAVYVTSVLCLNKVAKIKKGDTVLIHTASGGVGLSAINICKHVGCTIFATAGSKRKQNYLKALGIHHIFHSRNTNFGNEILEVTNGRGVDVVLNSLTSEGFKEASLKACAKGARFVEMSLLNIWSEKDVKQLRPDVVYTTVDLSKSNLEEWKQLMGDLKPLLDQNIIKPLPYVRFDAVNVREAINYMQKTKHIGKIVCVFPEFLNVGRELKPFTPIFNETSSYLITGGVGGIGFVVCEWMLENGAKYIVLATRTAPNITIQTRIKELNSKGSNVIAVQSDIGNFEQCKELIQSKIVNLKLPPLKGIMHAAGILSDDLIINHDWQTLSSVFKAKVEGTLNLHELTKDIELEHFVLFSSLASLLGPPGQCNHAAANCFEDTFAHYRHSIGLPATSINWGQWGEVGIATEADLPGIGNVSNLQGIRGLEYAIKAHRTQTAVVNVTSFSILSKFYTHLPTYLDDRIWKKSISSSEKITLKPDQFWEQYDSSSGTEEKIQVLKKQLRAILMVILKLEQNDIIEDDIDLHDLGVDSLMFVEIKNALQNLLGERLTVSTSSLKDCNTVTLIVEKLVGLMEGTIQDQAQEKPSMQEVNELIREDYLLPEHIKAKAGQALKPVNEVKTVLITGCTGSLGSYVLKELAKLPQIREIVCLVRPGKSGSLNERLLKTLRSKKLHFELGNIRCVGGSVTQPHLGMDLNVWEDLSENIDAIFHCAARVNHTEHYRRIELQNGIRDVNINGTKNILEFACEKNLKHVYCASTLFAVVTVDNERVSERWPELGEFDNMTTFAYPITKYVGDLIVKQGVERGIPCKVFRLPLLLGESETGRCSIENNHLLIRYMFIMKHGIMTPMPGVLPALPVDIAAKESVRLFFTKEAGSDIYHMSNGHPSTDQEFVEVAEKFGKNVDFVEFSEFIKRIKESDEKVGEAMKAYSEVYNDEFGIMAAFANAPFIQKWMENGENSSKLYWSEKISRFIPDFFENSKTTMNYIYNDLLFGKNEGWFEKFEIYEHKSVSN